jgi:hypothetical protein
MEISLFWGTEWGHIIFLTAYYYNHSILWSTIVVILLVGLTCKLNLITNTYVLGKKSTYRIHYYLWFQASTGYLEKYPLRRSGATIYFMFHCLLGSACLEVRNFVLSLFIPGVHHNDWWLKKQICGIGGMSELCRYFISWKSPSVQREILRLGNDGWLMRHLHCISH